MSARKDYVWGDDTGPTFLFARPLTPWWDWYAWYPVRTWDRRWRWLCWVQRRLMGKKAHLPGPIGSPWHMHRVMPDDRAERLRKAALI